MQKVNVIKITDATRGFLELLRFPEIPEEAQYVAFFEDGQAQFLEVLEGSFGFPDLYVIAAYKDLELEL